MKNNPTANYDKNAKPLVRTFNEKPFSKRGYRQGDDNNAPIVAPMAEKAPFGQSVNLTNEKSVTGNSSAKLQKASRLPGRVSLKGKSKMM